MSIKKDEIFEKVIESFDPLTGEKIEEKEKFVYRYDKNTGEKLEKKVIDIKESFDSLTGEKIIEAITEDDLLEKQEIKKDTNINHKEITKKEENVQLTNVININKSKKSKAPLFIGIIAVIVIIGSILIFSLNKVIENPHIKVGMAIKKTVHKSIEEIDSVFGLTQFYKMIENGTYSGSFRVNETTLGIGTEINFGVKNNSEVKADMKLFGLDIFDIFADQTDLYIHSKFISEDIYKLNYQKLEEKVDGLIQSGEFSKEEIEYLKQFKKYFFNYSQYSEITKQFYKNIYNKILKDFKDVEYEKIKDSKFEAYRFNFKSKEIESILNAFVDEIENNKEFKDFLVLYIFLIINEGDYDTIEEVENDVNLQLIFIKEVIKELALDSSDDIFMSVDTYLSKGYIKKLNFVLSDEYEDLEIGISFDDENYSLLNMTISLTADGDTFNISTIGENTNEKFEIGLKFQADEDYFGFMFEYDKNNNNITIGDLDETYTLLTGKIKKLEPGKEIDLYLDMPDDDIKIKWKLSNNVENVKKPEDNIVDVLELTEDDLNDILDSIYKKYWYFME